MKTSIALILSGMCVNTDLLLSGPHLKKLQLPLKWPMLVGVLQQNLAEYL